MASKRADTNTRPRRAPATTPEAREQQLTSLAYDEAERLMRAGEASSQVLTHFLKVGSVREQKELRRIELEAELASKKMEMMESARRVEELYEEAIRSMRTYGGERPEPSTDD